jgi:alkylation response protein AidB-like acyl-CoA dehydrogenase
MYSLHLSPEQRDMRETVRDFVARQVKPVALRSDRLEARERPLPTDLLDQASQLGLRTLALSEDAGGAGADTLTCCIVCEELAAGDPDTAAVLAQTWTLAHVLFDRLMAPDQRERFLPAFLAEQRYHLALASDEPGRDVALGIHYHRSDIADASFRTSAKRSGHGWIINGSKTRVVNAPLAKLFAVAVTTPENVTRTVLVPRDAPGVRVEISDASAAWQHGAPGSITLQDCQVPADHMLGPDEGATLAFELGQRMPQDLALNLGIGRAAYEAALDYAQLRVQGGRRIIAHQAIGAKLADIAIRLQVARTAIWQAAWASDHPSAVEDGSLPDLPLARMAKVFASEAVYQATKDAAECFGAMGVMRDMPLQKYVGDARICLHSGEPNSDTRLRVAEAIAGYQRITAPALAAE